MDPNKVIIRQVYNRPMLWYQKDRSYDKNLVQTYWQEIADEVGLTADTVRQKWKNLRDSYRKELKKLEVNQLNLACIRWPHFKALSFLLDVMVKEEVAAAIKQMIPTDLKAPGQWALDPTEDTTLGYNATSEDTPAYVAATTEDYEKSSSKSFDELDEVEKKPMAFQSQEVQSDNDSYAQRGSDTEDEYEPRKKRISFSQKVTPRKKTLTKKKASSASYDETNSSQRKKRKTSNGYGSSLDLSTLEAESLETEDEDLNFLKSLLPYMKQLSNLRNLQIRNAFLNLLIEQLK